MKKILIAFVLCFLAFPLTAKAASLVLDLSDERLWAPQDDHHWDHGVNRATGQVWPLQLRDEGSIYVDVEFNDATFVPGVGYFPNFVRVELIDSSGLVVESDTDDDGNISFQAFGLPAGFYTVRALLIAGVQASLEAYVVLTTSVGADVFEPNDRITEAANIPFPGLGQATIDWDGDHDWYKIDVGANRLVYAATYSYDPPYQQSITFGLQTRSGTQQSVPGTDIVTGALAQMLPNLVYRTTAPETIYMHALGVMGKTNYNFQLVQSLELDRFDTLHALGEQNNTFATATPLTSDSIYWPGLNIHFSTTDRDCYKFTLDSNDTGFVRIAFNASLGDVDVQVIDSNGQSVGDPVVYYPYAGPGWNERVNFGPLAAGTYAACVAANNLMTYSFGAGITRVPGGTPPPGAPDPFESNDSIQTATVLAIPSSGYTTSRVSGITIHEDDEDFFRFQLTPGHQATILVNYDTRQERLDGLMHYPGGARSGLGGSPGTLIGYIWDSNPHHLEIHGAGPGTNDSITLSYFTRPTSYAASWECGNVNLAGRVDINDVSHLARFFAGLVTLTPDQRYKANVFNDSAINFSDLLALARYVAGLTNTIVCTRP